MPGRKGMVSDFGEVKGEAVCLHEEESMTNLPTRQGTLNLSEIKDLYNGFIVSYQTSPQLSGTRHGNPTPAPVPPTNELALHSA